jgi:hypothetical protein
MTPFLIWLVRLLILILIVRLIMRSVTALSGRVPAGRARMSERAGGTLVRDPQCGTYIPEAGAVVAGAGADVHHFCSITCRDAWMATHPRARAKA